MKIEKVITSVTADLNYAEFISPSCFAWNRLYGIKPTVAYIKTGIQKHDEVWETGFGQMAKYGIELELLPIDRIPELDYGVQARATRMFLASHFTSTTNMIVDVDMIMLNKNFLGFADNIPDDHLVKFGYDHPSFQKSPDLKKWPMDKTVARGDVWGEIVNPKNLGYKEWVCEQTGFPEDRRSNIFLSFDTFCDESLLKCMTEKWGQQSRITKVRRDEVPCECPRDDRLYGRLYSQGFQTLKGVDFSKYYEVHGPRPFLKNLDWYKPAISYLEAQA